MFTGLGKRPSLFNPDLKISPEFPRGFSFHLKPKFPRGFPPPTTTIPGIPNGIREILPAGNQYHDDVIAASVHVK